MLMADFADVDADVSRVGFLPPMEQHLRLISDTDPISSLENW
jgi:hypothetical protein